MSGLVLKSSVDVFISNRDFVPIQNNTNQLIFPTEVHSVFSGVEFYRYLNFILILFFKSYIL
jgi:hypothetical protein